MTTLLCDSANAHVSDVTVRAAQSVAGMLGTRLDVAVDAQARQLTSHCLFPNAQLKLPALYLKQVDSVVHGKSTILRTMAGMFPESDLSGCSPFQKVVRFLSESLSLTNVAQGVVDGWLDFAFGEIEQAIIGLDRFSVKVGFREALARVLDAVDIQLKTSTFLALESHITIADLALFAVLINDTTKKPVFSEFNLAAPPAKSSRQGLARWVHHVAHTLAEGGLLGSDFLSPWGGVSVPTSVPVLHTSPSDSIGVVWLDSASEFVPVQIPSVLQVLPSLSTSAVSRPAEEVVLLDSCVYEMSQPTPILCAHGVPQRAEPDWNALDFMHQPWPSSFTTTEIEASAPITAEDFEDHYGDRIARQLGQVELKNQWLDRLERQIIATVERIERGTPTQPTLPTQSVSAQPASAQPTQPVTNEAECLGGPSPTAPWTSFKGEDPSAYATAKRMTQQCVVLGMPSGRGLVVPKNWYDMELEERRAFLGIPSLDQLCKSLVLRNTKWNRQGPNDERNSQYFLVLVQYSTRFHADKLKKFVRDLNTGRLGKNHFSFQLVDSEISDELTGYSKNSVTPIGMRTNLPIVLSKSIAELTEGYFVMGGGAEDVKVGVSTKEFIAAYSPFVADIIY